MTTVTPLDRAESLPCWSGPVEAYTLSGGITNINFTVQDGNEKFVVRIGDNILEHQVMRFNELAASRAAFAAGISPEVVYSEPGAMVLKFIEGKTLRPQDIQSRMMLERVVPLMRRCHKEVPIHFRGAVLAFWVFHVIRDYAHTIKEGHSRMMNALPELLHKAKILESRVGPIELVFGHNDLLAANFIDDGEKLWLLDWDYAGMNSPLFDLGGLASNNELSIEDEQWMLETYFEQTISDELKQQYAAMKCASLLRETMWSMVSELNSCVEFDFVAYTEDNLSRFEREWQSVQQM